MQAIVQYFKDSWSELKKVKWPTRNEVVNHTIMVVAVSLAVAAFLGILDLGLNELLERVI